MDRVFVWVLALALGFAPALSHAQSPQVRATVLQYRPPAPPAAGGITFTPTDAQAASPAFASGSFTAAVGSASTDRIVVLCYSKQSGSGLAEPTYGAGATAWTHIIGNGLTADEVELFSANIPTGTTLQINYPGGASGVVIAVGAFSGQSAGSSATLGNAAIQNANTAQPLNDPLNVTPITFTVPSGGIGVVCGGSGFTNGAAGPPTFTWTSVTNLSGDKNAFSAVNGQLSLTSMTTTAAPTLSSTISLSFSGGDISYASMAP